MTLPVAPTPPTLTLTGSVSTDTRRLATRDNLDAAGARFESIFIGMMLKSMRQARLAEGLFDSQAQQHFRDMQDQKLAESMATHAPIGIGRAMAEFLARGSGLGDAPAPAPAPATVAPATVAPAPAAPVPATPDAAVAPPDGNTPR